MPTSVPSAADPLLADASSVPGVVYIVEDDPAVRSAVKLLARCCGWQAQAWASGAEFLDAAPDEHGGCCLVLDLSMPGMDGEEVLRRLRARGSRLPVLVITGDRQGARLDRVRRLGALEVLPKPFGDDAFQQAVQRCLIRAPGPTGTA